MRFCVCACVCSSSREDGIDISAGIWQPANRVRVAPRKVAQLFEAQLLLEQSSSDDVLLTYIFVDIPIIHDIGRPIPIWWCVQPNTVLLGRALSRTAEQPNCPRVSIIVATMQIKLLLITFIALGSIELLSADGVVKKAGPVSSPTSAFTDGNKSHAIIRATRVTLPNYYHLHRTRHYQ